MIVSLLYAASILLRSLSLFFAKLSSTFLRRLIFFVIVLNQTTPSTPKPPTLAFLRAIALILFTSVTTGESIVFLYIVTESFGAILKNASM